MFACLAVHWMWLLGWKKTKWPSKPDDCTFGFVLCEPQICSHCPHITLTFRSGLCGLEPHWKPKHFSRPTINTHSCVAAADLLSKCFLFVWVHSRRSFCVLGIQRGGNANALTSWMGAIHTTVSLWLPEPQWKLAAIKCGFVWETCLVPHQAPRSNSQY